MKRKALICALSAMTVASLAWGSSPSGPGEAPAIGVHGLNLNTPNELGSDFQPFEIQRARPTGLSWFSSQRFTLSHSLSYGVYSGNQGTHSMGLWASRLSYRISRPLSVAAEVGLFMDPAQEQAVSADNIYLKSFDLNYRPSENFHMRIMYQGAPQGGYPGWATRHYDPFYDPYRTP